MNPALERQRAQFEADPSHIQAFEALEEHYFLQGAWPELVELYRLRLNADDLRTKPAVRARVLFRQGQVLEERCERPAEALACFEQAARLAPDFQPALRRLRAHYLKREQWELALQVAELEASTPMRPAERAAFLVEVGGLWLERLREPEQALAHFDKALQDDARGAPALAGRARALEALGRHADAAATWERLVEIKTGPEQATGLVGLARLYEGALNDPNRALELYQRALSASPGDAESVEAIVANALARGRWDVARDVAETRFRIAHGAERRTAIALETAAILLKRLGDPEGARRWLERARELGADDSRVHLGLAEAAARAGDRAAQAASLERVAKLTRGELRARTLVQLAELRSAEGDAAAAFEHLRTALDLMPDSIETLDALVAAAERAGRYNELSDLLETRAALAGEDAPARARALAQLGALHERHTGELDAACDAWRRAFETDPAAPGALAALDRLYRKHEAWDELHAVLSSALQSAAGDERVLVLTSLGELFAGPLAGRAEPGAARTAFEEALGLDPRAPRALRGLARLAEESGDEGALLAALGRELDASEDPERAATLRGELAGRHEARGELALALRFAEQALAQQPDARVALETCARLHERMGDGAALAALLARLAPLGTPAEAAATWRRVAALRGEAGDADAALEAWRQALAADPDDLETLRVLVAPLRAAGRGAERARVLRRLSELAPDPERAAALSELAELLAGELGDPNAAVVVLWRLVEDPDAPADVDARLEALLERTGRFEELAQLLADRRHTLEPGSPEAVDLDLRRADLLREHLGQLEQAALLYRELCDGLRPDDARVPRALQGLEACARAAGDDDELVFVLERRSRATGDPALALERAEVLEERLERLDEAIASYAELAGRDDAVGARADQRLVRALERAGSWQSLREHLEARVGRLGPVDALAVHERLAEICLARLADEAGGAAHLAAAAALAPERGALSERLAELHERAGRTREARDALVAALAAGPDPQAELGLRVRVARLCRDALDDPAGAQTQLERVLTLSPGHAEAVAFLADRYQRDGRIDELAALLSARLVALDARGSAAERTALRLRLAELHAEHRDDLAAAVAVLEPAAVPESEAAEALSAAALAAESLAELYTRSGRMDALAALARRLARSAPDAGARAAWWLRLGFAARACGDAEAAIAACREALDLCPHDAAAENLLCELLRETGQAAPLARLLEAGLGGLSGARELSVRLELAALFAGPLARPADAAVQLRRALEIDPGHAAARAEAQRVADAVDAPELALALLDGALARAVQPDERAGLLRRRARLLGERLGRGSEAVAAWREALALAPDDPETRRALRSALQDSGDWSGFLEELYTDARQASGAERVALLEQGARIAAEQLQADAALPWLERLRAERPQDPALAARIAEVHRRAGRPEALLRALEVQIGLSREPARRVALQLELARVLERELGARARARSALEQALRDTPDEPALLAELARLYADAGRPRERAEVLERRLAGAPDAERGTLHRELAALYLEPLGEPDRAAAHAAAALRVGAGPRAALLQLEGRALRAAGRTLAWAERAEQELEALDPRDPMLADRRRVLHRELATAAAHLLGDPDRALAHLRALVDAPEPDADDALAAAERDTAECALLDVLRAREAHPEFAERLARRLARRGDDLAGWLELGRLREERLHAPSAAGEAYAEALARDPRCLDALRGQRRSAERRCDWAGVAGALERELELRADALPGERAALHRRLGEITGQRLLSTTRARRAFGAALELEPGDLVSLRALERLCEDVEDWRGALSFYAREREVLGERDPARLRELLLRSALLARERVGEDAAAIEALEAADRLAPLALGDRRALAELQRKTGDLARFSESFAPWCDDPRSGARGGDHLTLADALESLGRLPDARERVERGLAVEPGSAALWQKAGELHVRLGEPAAAADAFVRCANRSASAAAAPLLVRAAELVEGERHEQALAWLREAVECDAGSARAHAARARVALRCDERVEAEDAAARALELGAAPEAGLAREERLAAALVGARAARARGALEAAARFATTARALGPDSPEALALEGEVLLAMGEIAGARRALEGRLALRTAADDPERPALLSALARALEAAGDADAALARFEEALALDADCEEARAGIARLHERAGRLDAALATRLAWAERAAPRRRAEQLTCAAELELARSADDAAAERHLRAALEADPSHAGAGLLLATRLAESGRADEALALVVAALEHASDGDVRARLAILHARLLELRGERRAAADAYARAADADPRAASAALARARILRALGEWGAAADGLARFAELHPDAEPAELAQVQFQRGRLLAGPLERLDEALEAYRSALRANPRFRDAHIALASLLVHRIDCFEEALARHRELLDATPADAGFLRGVLRMAENRGLERAATRGRAILRALGAASPSEREVAPGRLDFRAAEAGALENPVWERARKLAQAASDELGRALGAQTADAPEQPPKERLAAFHAAALAAEARLAAPALLPLSATELGEVLRITALLASDAPHVHGDGHRVNALSRELGRRARRRVQRELDGLDPNEIAEIDFTGWRRELRTLAHAEALDALGGDLRTALVALLESVGGATPEPGPEADVSAAVAGSPAAAALLRRVVLAWVDGLASAR